MTIVKRLFQENTEVSQKENDQNLISDFLFDKSTRTFLGYENCKTNVLAERDDSVVKSLCYDA